MAQYGFGSGVVFAIPLTNAQGNSLASGTPVRFGVLQDVSVDFSFTNKELHGQNQFPVAIGRGQGKITGKAKFGQFNGALVNSLFFGQTLASGQSAISDKEVLTITSDTGTVANSTTFEDDLGVVYVSNGLPLTRVAASPVNGQYSVTPAGVYTFAASDTGAVTGNILVSYRYQTPAAGTSATSITLTNQLMGYAPTFRAELYVPYASKQLVITLNQCIGSKLNFATKLDDFLIPEFDFEAFADASNTIGSINFAE